jgi:putative oxidoreductase
VPVPELKFDVEEPKSRIDTLRTWLPRIAVAVAFLSIGYSKFETQSMWIRTFNEIGFGDWFRYFTGAVQMLGAVLVLIPRTCVIGIAILSSTMIGAALIWIFLLHAPGNAPIPLVVLAALIVVGFQARRT